MRNKIILKQYVNIYKYTVIVLSKIVRHYLPLHN